MCATISTCTLSIVFASLRSVATTLSIVSTSVAMSCSACLANMQHSCLCRLSLFSNSRKSAASRSCSLCRVPSFLVMYGFVRSLMPSMFRITFRTA